MLLTNFLLLIFATTVAGHAVIWLHRQGFWTEPIHCLVAGLLLSWLVCWACDCFAVQVLTLAVALFTAQLIWLGHQTPQHQRRTVQRWASYRIVEAIQC